MYVKTEPRVKRSQIASLRTPALLPQLQSRNKVRGIFTIGVVYVTGPKLRGDRDSKVALWMIPGKYVKTGDNEDTSAAVNIQIAFF